MLKNLLVVLVFIIGLAMFVVAITGLIFLAAKYPEPVLNETMRNGIGVVMIVCLLLFFWLQIRIHRAGMGK